MKDGLPSLNTRPEVGQPDEPITAPTRGALVVAGRFTRSRPKGRLRVLINAISILALAVLAARLVAVAWVLTLTALIVQFSMPVVGIWMSGPLPPVALVVKGTLVDTKVLVVTAHDGVGVGVGPGVG